MSATVSTKGNAVLITAVIRAFDQDTLEPIRIGDWTRDVEVWSEGSDVHTARDLAERATSTRRLSPDWYGFADVTFTVCEPCSNVVSETKTFAFEVSEYGRDKYGTRNVNRRVRQI